MCDAVKTDNFTSMLASLERESLAMLERTGLTPPPRGKKQQIKDFVKKHVLGRDLPVFTPDYLFWPAGMLALGLSACDSKEAAAGILNRVRLFAAQGAQLKTLDDALYGCAILNLLDIEKPLVRENLLERKDIFVREVLSEEERDLLNATAEQILQFVLHAKKDPSGAYIYRPGREKEPVLADGVGMASMFLAMAAAHYGETAYLREAISQLRIYCGAAAGSSPALIYHGYDHGEVKGHAGWGRAAGWILMGLAAAYSAAVKMLPEEDADRKFLADYLPPFIADLETYRRSDGTFPWLLSENGGHRDLSCTAMLTFSELLLHEAGLPGMESAMENAARCAAALPSYITSEGKVAETLAECLDFGVHPQIYGTYPWGQGSVLYLLQLMKKTAERG